MISEIMGPVLLGMVVTLAVALALVWSRKWHGGFSYDSAEGVQRVHEGLVPRIGVLALLAGYLAAWLGMDSGLAGLFGLMAMAGAPVVVAGLAEDLSKAVGVKLRLLAAVLSGTCFVLVSGYAVTKTEISVLDPLLAVPLLALVFSAVAMAGVACAINFIDGFNGLAAGTTLILMLAFALAGAQAGDVEFVQASLILAALFAGFLLVNFPFGKLFLGDGGAFFAGYLLAAMAVALPARNPETSPWVSAVILGYPVLESLFTLLRRLRKGKGQWACSESSHLHHLVYRGWAQATGLKPPVLQNALTSVFVWTLPFSSMIFVALGPVSRTSALWYLLALAGIYLIWYWRLAAAAAPRPVSL